MDIYTTPEPVMLDERALSEKLGVSRTPIREAIAMLEQDGLVKALPRRGIVVVRKTKAEIVDMIRAWAALESMAARLITQTAHKSDIAALRDVFRDFGPKRLPQDHIEDYSRANIAFHQALISLSESPVLVDMTNDILIHVRGYRQLTDEAKLLAEAAKQIERVGLKAEIDQLAGSLSLGQQRIVEIARALCADPELLMLDEPAAGLRHMEKQRLAALLRQLRDGGMSVLLVEHDMGFVMDLADRIVVLDFGTRIAEGTPAAIKTNPEVIKAYLGALA